MLHYACKSGAGMSIYLFQSQLCVEQRARLLPGFQGNFLGLVVFILVEIILQSLSYSAVINRFEFQCQSKTTDAIVSRNLLLYFVM